MKRTRFSTEHLYVKPKLEDSFEMTYFADTTAPFLHFKVSFEDYFYYFNRFKISISEVEFISLKRDKSKTQIALIANSFEDMKLGERILRDYNLLKSKNTEVFIIPLGFDWHLSKEQVSLYHHFVAQNVDLLISLGGDDIHPLLYEQENQKARNVFYDRDLSEFNLVKFYKSYSKGIYLGICRGHQLSAVIEGFELIQDLGEIDKMCLEKHFQENQNQRDYLFHEITIKPSLLSRLLGFKTTSDIQLKVNSYHHQAVKCQSKSHTNCVAYDSEHHIAEALISNDLRSISVQFHPELPNEINKNNDFTELGHAFIKRVVAYSRLIRYKSKKNKLDITKNPVPTELSNSPIFRFK